MEAKTVALSPDCYQEMTVAPKGVRLIDVFPDGIVVSMRGDEITILTPFDASLLVEPPQQEQR